MVELALAAVARAWPRLRGWLDDDAEGQRMWRHLSTAAASWEAMGYADSELYRGARLQQAMEWRAGADVELNPSDRAFLDASHHQADAERNAARRRRQVFTVLVGGATVLALVLGSIAVVQARRSAEERDRAVAAEDEARLEALVDQSLALRATDRAVGALLAVEAHRRAPSNTRPMSALLGTFTAAPGFMGYIHLRDDQPLATAALLPEHVRGRGRRRWWRSAGARPRDRLARSTVCGRQGHHPVARAGERRWSVRRHGALTTGADAGGARRAHGPTGPRPAGPADHGPRACHQRRRRVRGGGR